MKLVFFKTTAIFYYLKLFFSNGSHHAAENSDEKLVYMIHALVIVAKKYRLFSVSLLLLQSEETCVVESKQEGVIVHITLEIIMDDVLVYIIGHKQQMEIQCTAYWRYHLSKGLCIKKRATVIILRSALSFHFALFARSCADLYL